MELNKKNKLPMIKLFNKIKNEEGLKSFTKGAAPRIMRVAPACAIMISSYEYLKSFKKSRQID